MFEFLGIQISSTAEPMIWLPIAALVIAWLFASKAIRSLQKDKWCQYLEETNQELYRLLLGAYRTVVFLSFLIFFVSLVLLKSFLINS